MTKPLPNTHAAAEPWFQYLRSLKPAEHPTMRGFEHVYRTERPREFAQAVLEVLAEREEACRRRSVVCRGHGSNDNGL